MEAVVLLVVVLMASYGAISNAANPVIVRPTSLTAMVGNDIKINCTVKKNTSEIVQWLNRDVNVISRGSKIVDENLASETQLGRLSITGQHDAGEYNLNIHNVQPEDAGKYQCGYFSVSDRSAYFIPVILRVILSPMCELLAPTTGMEPGHVIEMVCTSQNIQQNSALTWLRNGQPLRGEANGPAQKSLTVSYLLTDGDVDQPFTCVERMSPLAYVPHCSITPLRGTHKPVHVVSSRADPLTVGDIVHLACLTNQSLEDPTYSWFVGEEQESANMNIFSFGPIAEEYTNTTISCEVFRRDGRSYGRDTINVTVLPSIDAIVLLDVAVTSSLNPFAVPFAVTDNLYDRAVSQDSSTTTELSHLQQDSATMSNMVEGYMLIFILVASAVGVLLLVAIVCLALVLTRGSGARSRSKNNSLERIDTSSYSDFRGDGMVDNSATDANIINERVEAATNGTRPHYFTLEPNGSKKAKGKERKNSDTTQVTYTKVSKNKKSFKRFSKRSGAEEGEVNIVGSDGAAYAVTTVAKPSMKRPMSARRPLPERPDGDVDYKIPRSYSESRKDYVPSSATCTIKELAERIDPSTPAEETEPEPTKEQKIDTLIIDADYTEVSGTAVRTADLSLKERPYEFTSVYDAVYEKGEKTTLKATADSGYHDSSSSDGTELQEVEEDDGRRSEESTSSSFQGTTSLVRIEAETNLYASLKDLSVAKD